MLSLRSVKLLASTLSLLVCVSPLLAEHPWPDKDGPTKNGVVPDKHAKGLPTEWDEATGKNIAWKTDLKETGHSVPIIGFDYLWFTSATDDGTKQYVNAVDLKTGAIKHHKLLFENPNPEPLGNKVNTYASPSCVLDDSHVYVSFGTYGTAKLDPKSLEVVWQRRDINVRHFRGPGSSPVLFENLLIITMDGIDRQFVTALDKDTGKTVWLTKRSTDYGDLDENGKPSRDGDMRKAYHTPIVMDVSGTPHLISVGSRALFGYDARTGKEIWTIVHENYNAAIRPLIAGGMAIINTGSSRAHVLGVRLDESAKGNITKSHIIWDRAKRNARFSRHTLADGRLLQTTEGGIVSCIDVKTGKELWSGRLDGTYMASPIVANGHAYFFNESGVSTVLKLGGTFQPITENELEYGFQASPSVADGALYLRSKKRLYKIAQH